MLNGSAYWELPPSRLTDSLKLWSPGNRCHQRGHGGLPCWTTWKICWTAKELQYYSLSLSMIISLSYVYYFYIFVTKQFSRRSGCRRLEARRLRGESKHSLHNCKSICILNSSSLCLPLCRTYVMLYVVLLATCHNIPQHTMLCNNATSHDITKLTLP